MAANSQPLVSVITPVYNGEKYLAECIESIIGQTYENWEYIIVNNCSTDESLQIARDYAKKDSRIRIHDNSEFLPMIKNFNHALKQIAPESKYCKEIHADDMLLPECLEKMVSVAEKFPSISMVSAYRIKGCNVVLDGLPYPIMKFSGREICRNFFIKNQFVFGSPSSVMYRAKEVRKRKNFYNENYILADTEVCFKVLKDTDFGFVHQVLTYTRVHDDQETSNTAFFHIYQYGKLYLLKKFGHYYLSDREYNWYLNKELKKYYRLLAKTMLRQWLRESNPRRIEYYEYHQKALKHLGYSLKSFNFVKGIFAYMINRLLNKLMIKPKISYY